MNRPRFRTAEECDVYVLGLMCGAIAAVKGRCEESNLMGVEPVEELVAGLAAHLEDALDLGEQSFEHDLKDRLAGTRISAETLTGAWELGYKNGLQVNPGPLPEIGKP